MFYQAHNKIAVCKVKMGDFSAAEKELQKSLKIQPDDQGTIKYIGYVFLEDKKYDEAKLYLDSAKKISKPDPELEFFIGNLKLVGKNLKGALSNFEEAIDLKPNYAEAYLKRGLIYFAMKNYKYAIRDLSKSLELNPADTNNIELYRSRADANYEMHQFDAAIKDYSRVVIIDPKNEDAFIFRGAAKIEVNDNSGAVDDETKAIEINKTSHVAYNYRGVAKGALKSYGEAIKDLDMAIKLKANYASAFVNRASVKYAMNEKKKACDDLYKADQMGSNIAYKYIEAYCKGIEGQK
jgi:tetratricopeptide (TPR) repeat protein